ncbi:hypothetical protein JD844_033121 [Phrynosoma platyrhinos]|uniref:3CxxC-type domain-containing protein n=1 Tax=Phrynosoma platyrhinos TaxID=52577 RepID=A0ABQ7T651_PHRPL|nr:hypothetical protein JD844_033121 [Phrynosoma platyrhinos]
MGTGVMEAMERFVYPPYGIYQGFGSTFAPSHNAASAAPRPPSKQKQPSWKQSKGGGAPNPYRGVLPGPAPSGPSSASSPPEYLDPYKRAQLKALLTHVSPGLPSRLRRANSNTKEVGVQVNPRVDAAVQCSLGSRPLQAAAAAAAAIVRPQSPSSGRLSRQPRSGVYSPVLGAGHFTCPEAIVEEAKEAEEEEEEEKAKGAEDSHPEPEVKEAFLEESEEASEEASGNEYELQFAILLINYFLLQFLEQKYGYFHCNDCKTRWESAYVWCISGTNKVYFKQLCRKCQKSFNPYKVEAIQCHICSKTRCSCPQKKRHIDLKRPHRQELCGRCKGKRLSCDNTYSFKYII